MTIAKKKTIINFDKVIELDNNGYTEWVNSLPSTFEDEGPEKQEPAFIESKIVSGQFDYLESIRNSTEELPF